MALAEKSVGIKEGEDELSPAVVNLTHLAAENRTLGIQL
jgi:hypothetical protein